MSQKILITGTNSGFGRLTALELARRGHTVFGTMRDISGRNRAAAEELHAIAQREGRKLHVVEMDVTSDASVDAAVKQVLQKAETLDVVVNNAGVAGVGLEETLTSEQLLDLFNVNVAGPHRVMRAVLPSMRARGKGLVINVSSGLGRLVLPLMGVYCASKAALESLSEGYRYELKVAGIEVTLVQPGAFPTELVTHMITGKDAERAKGYGPLANGVEMMGATFQKMFSGPDAPKPQEVANAIAGVVETPAGSRPDRVVVDKMTGEAVGALNRAHGEVQKGVLTGMGMA